MKNLTLILALGCAVFVPTAGAYEYVLQFTPNPGYRGLVVAGYEFDNSEVTGNCSYYTVHSGSGRGGGYHTKVTHYNQTCKWDLYGNLLSVTAGAPAIPAALFVNGTQTVYAVNGSGEYTGTDKAVAHGGFVNTPGSHYKWTTSNAYTVLQQKVYTFTATLKSDGDRTLAITALEVSALAGKAKIHSATCMGKISAGKTCSVTVSYDPTQLISDSGLAYDTLTLEVTSNSGQAEDFIQGYTIVLNPATD